MATVAGTLNSILDTNWDSDNYSKPTICYLKDGVIKPTSDYIAFGNEENVGRRVAKNQRKIIYEVETILNVVDYDNFSSLFSEFLRCYDEENASASRTYYRINILSETRINRAFTQSLVIVEVITFAGAIV